MRKSIFDIASENICIEDEIKRIVTMAEDEYILYANYSYIKLFKFVDEYCFKQWGYRGHFINVDDYLKALNYTDLKRTAPQNVDSMLTVIELIYNFWNLSQQEFYDNKKGYDLKWRGNYYHLRDVMDDILQQYNHVAYANEDNDCILVIEDKEEVTAVAEIVPSAMAFDIIKYNHRSLQGEIELKKSILISMGAELEPKRRELQSINKQLSEDIFFMLNNINVRHNNRSKKDKSKYKEYVAKMSKARLEKWYDELYQMMLLAFLLLDNVDRTANVKDLKEKIVGGQANG